MLKARPPSYLAEFGIYFTNLQEVKFHAPLAEERVVARPERRRDGGVSSHEAPEIPQRPRPRDGALVQDHRRARKRRRRAADDGALEDLLRVQQRGPLEGLDPHAVDERRRAAGLEDDQVLCR